MQPLSGNNKIVLCVPPKRLDPNARSRTWHAKAREAKKYRAQVAECGIAWIVERYGSLSRPNFATARVRLVYQFGKRARRRDADNLLAWAKAAIDGLVDAGVFSDDRGLSYEPVEQVLGVDLPALVVEIVGVLGDGEDVSASPSADVCADDVAAAVAALDVSRAVLRSYSLSSVAAIGHREATRVAALADIERALFRLRRS